MYSLDTVLNPEADAKYQYTIGDLTNASGFKNLLKGTERANRFTLSHEYAHKVVDEVADSISFENGVLSFSLPDIKSQYHHIGVVADFGDGDPTHNIHKVWKSDEVSGDIDFQVSITPTTEAKVEIFMEGIQLPKEQCSTVEDYMYASSSYDYSIDFVRGIRSGYES
jgi:hypothetical protein